MSALAEPGPAVLGEGATLAPGITVIEHLSRSRVLDVFWAWSEERACDCIAKVLRPDRRDDADAARALRAEGRLLLRLAHPHIVRAYELVGDPPLLVLETLNGDTVGHMTRDGRRLGLTEAAWLGVHLCSAIGYLHAHGWLHLDIKPSNVISDRGLAKVLDLSIARRPGRGRRGAGTAQYLAPEQARGDRLSAATDAWGIGGLLFQALTGRRPFGPSGSEQLDRRADLLRVHRRLPAPLRDAVDACLEPAPEDRPGVAELGAVLEGYT